MLDSLMENNNSILKIIDFLFGLLRSYLGLDGSEGGFNFDF